MAAASISVVPCWSMLIAGVPTIASEYVAVTVISPTFAGFALYVKATVGTCPSAISVDASCATTVFVSVSASVTPDASTYKPSAAL